MHAATAISAATDPMVPRLFRVERSRRDLGDTVTLFLTAADGGRFRFAPGQFNMLYVFGVGEVPISISGDPADTGTLVHTIRGVGAVSEALCALKPGDTLGVRGPYGTPWPVGEAYGQDVVFVAGGIGLAPLRPAILQVLAERERFGNVVLCYGARTPGDILFAKELHTWRGRFDFNVQVTVDRVTGPWNGTVGVVTHLIGRGGFDHHNTVSFVCGPEVMMRYTVLALRDAGVGTERVHVSMERNMKCGVGLCGHCQFGPGFVCRDGPVYRFDRIADIFAIEEL